MCQNINPEKEAVYCLDDGKVFIDYGPVSMVVTAKKDGKMQTDLARESFYIVRESLRELAGQLENLRKYSAELCGEDFEGLPRNMVEAVKSTGEPTLTPMAAVAGGLADQVADWLSKEGADTVIVNNGGDIALRLSPGQEIKMGILPDIYTGQMDKIVAMRGEDGIGGVCTSGLGGRSLTRGVANAVTVFSRRCVIADACATHIANQSFIASPSVEVVLAKTLDPGSDIGELTVVKSVGILSQREVEQSLEKIKKEAGIQKERGNISCLAADVQGNKWYDNV